MIIKNYNGKIGVSLVYENDARYDVRCISFEKNKNYIHYFDNYYDALIFYNSLITQLKIQETLKFFSEEKND